jgi:hypothetical protein
MSSYHVSLTGAIEAPIQSCDDQRSVNNRTSPEQKLSSEQCSPPVDKVDANNETTPAPTPASASQKKRGDTSRAQALMVAVGQLLFTQGVCVPDGQVSSLSPIDDRIDAIDEDILW